MKKTHLTNALLSIFIWLSITTSAQEYNTKFGQCSLDEINLKSCAFDSTAGAMVLYDIGEVKFVIIGQSYHIMFDRRIKVKILNTNGIKHSEFKIPLYKGDQGFEKVSGIKGVTYNLVNGKIEETKLDSKTIFEEKEDDDWYNKKFALPAIKEGSVYEVKYTITSPYFFSLPDWDFQRDIPVLYSEYNATINPHFEYTFILKGNGKLSEYQKYESLSSEKTHINGIDLNDLVYKYVMKDVPAFKDEAFITSVNDYKCKLDIQLSCIVYESGKREQIMSTWPKVCEELRTHENFGSYMKSWEREGDEILGGLDFSSLSNLEKAKKIDKYIKSKFVFNGLNRILSSGKKKDIERSNTGNSADLNLMAVGLLNSAGIEAYPILISTRSHGKVQTIYPFVNAFNYVVAAAIIDSVVYMIDATEPMLNFNQIPPKCLNDVGIMVTKKDGNWLNINSLENSDTKFEITLQPDLVTDSLISHYKVTYTYFDALEKRKSYKNDYEKLSAELLGKDYIIYDSIKCSKLSDIESPFELVYNKNITLERIDDMIIIEPFCGKVFTENPLKQATRTYPIDLGYKYSKTLSTDIFIPEGYKLLTKPENLIVNNKDIRIVYTIIEKDERHLNVIGLYQFKKDVYDPSSYIAIKEYLDSIVTKFNEKIVLKAVEI